MSRHTFTTEQELWSVGYDPVLETYYAQVEPRRDRTDSADATATATAERGDSTGLNTASEQEPPAALRTPERDAELDRTPTPEQSTDPRLDAQVSDDELQDVAGDTPGQVPTAADLERLLSARVQLPQAVIEQLLADTPLTPPDVNRVAQRLEAAEHLVVGAQENAEDLQARWAALKASSISNRLTSTSRTRPAAASPANSAPTTPITPDAVNAAERAQAEDRDHHQQPGRGPARGPRH